MKITIDECVPRSIVKRDLPESRILTLIYRVDKLLGDLTLVSKRRKFLMFKIPTRHLYVRRMVTSCLVVTLFAVTSAFAQTAPRSYKVELVVPSGKKSVETDAMLTIGETTFRVEPDKASFKSETREFNYTDIKTADYSYAKKPMLSGGGAVATALLVGVIFALPFLFIKKKKHWLTVQTEKEFAVIKLSTSSHRQIVAELKTHGVTVSELKEEGK